MSVPALTERNWSTLGLLRFILACSVMTTHLCFAMGQRHWQQMLGGLIPVCGFFLISGFSIAASIKAQPHGYFLRRIWRIYPLSIASVILTLGVVAFTGSGETEYHNIVTFPSVYNILCTVFLLNGLLAMTHFIFSPLWSLNCEMIYYLAAPLLVRLSTPTIIALIAASLLLFEYTLHLSDGITYNYRRISHGGAVAVLLWLWLLGFLAQRHSGNKWLILVGCCASGVVLAHSAISEGALALPIFIIVVLVVTAFPYMRLPHSWVIPANYLGELSYPIYVLHFPVVLFAWHALAGQSPLLITFFVWGVSLLLSIAAYHGIDRQLRNPRRVRAE